MREKTRKLLEKIGDFLLRTIVAKGAVFLSNAALDFVLFRLLTGVFSVFAPLSQFLSYAASSVTRYFAYSFIKYNRTGDGHAVRFFRFLCINLLFAVMSPAILSLLMSAGISAKYAKLAVLGLTTLTNFLCYKFVVFI